MFCFESSYNLKKNVREGWKGDPKELPFQMYPHWCVRRAELQRENLNAPSWLLGRGAHTARSVRHRRGTMLPRHLPAVLACLIAALLVQWVIRRSPQRSAVDPVDAAALVATLDELLATHDWDGAYAAWRSVLQQARAPGVPVSTRRDRIAVANRVARARVERMGADYQAGFPLSSTPPFSSPTFEVVVEALRGAAIFATVDAAQGLLLHALKERPFAEIAEGLLWEPELTCTSRGLRTVRAGYAYLPPVYCT